jgi:hypothetical protein
MFTPPPAPARYGYATKIWLASHLEDLQFGGRYYVWFSLQLNPLQNGESSNPLLLYRQIDTAVKKNDVNHPKIKDPRANLLVAIARFVEPGNPTLAESLTQEVLRAPVEMFRPQLWRLDVSSISPVRWDATRSIPGWDEYLINDLAAGEFKVIVE